MNFTLIKDFANILRKEKSVAVICHIRPDGDAIGSAVALYLGLNSINIKAEVFCDDNIPQKFNFLESVGDIKREFKGEFSAIISVDSADITRVGDFAGTFDRHKNTFNLDHHVSNNRYAKYNFVLDLASNAENVFALLKELKVNITKEIANLLLMGVMTDTGGFKHKNVTEETLKTASELIKYGADNTLIYYNCFTKQTKQRAKLFALTMSKIRYFLDQRFVVISIFKKDLQETGATPDETEGFIDFIMGIDGVEVGASVMQMEENKYKISFRGKETDVNAVAQAFGGGGHVLASGCQIYGEYEEVIDKICYAVKVNIRD
ncbi:MAG: bifunctional oligoribonuclease/PAP phosphatase NrnA [Clostridia bacterium]|nr:bifunctional oligoribonuclease/PAP phosphatase NrnA [Clostridia bacterium]